MAERIFTSSPLSMRASSTTSPRQQAGYESMMKSSGIPSEPGNPTALSWYTTSADNVSISPAPDTCEVEYRHWKCIDSTHTWVEKHYGDLDSSKVTCVSANYQTAGRGTGNRKWLASAGQSVLCSYYFSIPEHMKIQAACFVQVAALSIIKTLRKRVVGGCNPPTFHLKWPNDIMVNGKKMGGILSRMVIDPVRHTIGEKQSTIKTLVERRSQIDAQSMLTGTRSSGTYMSPPPNEPTVDNIHVRPCSLLDHVIQDAQTAGGSSDSPKTNSPRRVRQIRKHEHIEGKQVGMIVSPGLNINYMNMLTIGDKRAGLKTEDIMSKDAQRENASANPVTNTTTPTNERFVTINPDGTTNFVWPASSLRQEICNPSISWDCDMVRHWITVDLIGTIEEFVEQGYAAFAPAISDTLLYKGQEISFAPHGRDNAERVTGVLNGLDSEGWICITDKNGSVQKFCSGELVPKQL